MIGKELIERNPIAKSIKLITVASTGLFIKISVYRIVTNP
ncbi:hypothetical protein LLB_1308 [Legionella longbeachae D-4968]|nr:hypothetical protein LLB_1308 [Legionella longbeachae D-4968]